MKDKTWWESQLEYGHDLIYSAVEGARAAGEHALAVEPVSDILARSVRESLPWDALGAGVALLATSAKKHRNVREQALFVLLVRRSDSEPTWR